MADDMTELGKAFQWIGNDEASRCKLLSFCREIERDAGLSCSTLRENVTGPVLDAVMKGRVFQRKLKDGTVIEMTYLNKISRDFLLSPEDPADHVWEPQTTRLLLHLAQHAQQVVIGGAYVGDQAILVSKQLALHGGTCHAFEPDESSFAFLKRNVKLNHLENLQCHQSGLWSHDGFIRLEGCDAFSTPVETGDAAGIPTFSISHYARNRDILKMDLIMLDVEGGELQALRGAEEFLAQPANQAPDLVFEIHRNYVDWSEGLEETEIIRYLKSWGYVIHAVRDYHSNHPMEGSPIELIPLTDIYLEGPPHGFNMLAVKDAAKLDTPLFKIVTGVSPKLLLNRDPALHQPSHS